jgi:hypothetical protein
MATFSQGFEYTESVHAGHHNVAHHQIWRRDSRGCDARLPGSGFVDFELFKTNNWANCLR